MRSLAVPDGVWLQRYGKVCQKEELDALSPPLVCDLTTGAGRRYKTDASIDGCYGNPPPQGVGLSLLAGE